MAAPPQLLLLVSDAETPEDFNICVSTLVWSLAWGPTTVVSSLAKSAVDIVIATKGIDPVFQCSFDTEWDPLKSENAIVEHTIMDNGELQSYYEELGIQFKKVDFENYSTEKSVEEYHQRLEQAIFGRREGTLTVVAPSATISACIERLGMQPELCPTITTWNISHTERTGKMSWSCETLTELKELLQGQQQLREAQRPVHKVTPPKVADPSVNIPQPPGGALQPGNEELLRIAAEAKERLKLLIDPSVPGSANPLKDTLLTLTTALEQLHNQFRTMTTNHEQEKRDRDQEIDRVRKELTDSRSESTKQLETVKAQYNSQLEELDRKMTREVEERVHATNERYAQMQQRLETVLNDVAELKAVAVQPRVEEPVKPLEKPVEVLLRQHEGQLQRQEQPPASPQAEEGKEPAAKPVGDGPPLQVVEISRKPDGKLTATVLNRSSNEIWGYLCVLQQGEYKVYSPQPLSFVGQSNIDMSDWAQIPPGQYDAIIVNIQNAPESSPFPFTLADAQVNNPPQSSQDTGDAYSQCFVCLNLSNIRQLEEYIHTNQGEAALTTFKKLASEWGNPMHDQVYNFVQVFIAEPFVDEAAVRQRLEANGFQLRQT